MSQFKLCKFVLLSNMALFSFTFFIAAFIYVQEIKSDPGFFNTMVWFTKNDKRDAPCFDCSCQTEAEDTREEFLSVYGYPQDFYDSFNEAFLCNEVGYRTEEAKPVNLVLQKLVDSTKAVDSCCFKGARLEPEWKGCVLDYKEDKTCSKNERVTDMAISPCYSSSVVNDVLVYSAMTNTTLGCCPQNACLARNMCSF